MFSVRIGRIAVSVAMVAILLATPFIDVLVMKGGVRWLAAFGVVAAMAAVAAALAVALTVALFRSIGPKRTRLVAQIVAASSAHPSSSGCRWRRSSLSATCRAWRCCNRNG